MENIGTSLLSDKELTAFVSTTNPGKAKSFYGDILGLRLLFEDNYGLGFDANGTLLRVSFVQELKPQNFTVLGWKVADVSLVVKLLNKKGVICEKYNSLEQDSLNIWTSPRGSKVAWFKDSDGNILSLTEV